MKSIAGAIVLLAAALCYSAGLVSAGPSGRSPADATAVLPTMVFAAIGLILLILGHKEK